MKRIEWFWNMVYYNIYKCDTSLRRLFNCINPFYLLNKLPAVKRFYDKHGVYDMNKFANRVLSNPKSGLSSIWAGSIMGGLLVLIGIGILNILEILVGRSLIKDVTENSFHFLIFFIVLLVPTVLINNYLLFRKDKYLNYFKELEAMTDKKKLVYGWLSFFVVLLTFTFCIGSFLVLN